MSQHGDRRLAYAAAMGLADSATAEVPIVPEDSHLAWSDATGYGAHRAGALSRSGPRTAVTR